MPPLLRLHCRLHCVIMKTSLRRSSSVYSGVEATPHSCGIMLLAKQYDTIQGHYQYGVIAFVNTVALMPLAASSPSYLYSGDIATCGIIAVLSMRHHYRLIAASLPTYISVLLPTCNAALPADHCGNIAVIIAASLPT